MDRIGGIAVALWIGMAGAAFAQAEGTVEVPRGLWETPLDAQGVKYHVRTRRCGRALCGRVERAKNRRGFDTPSNAVGDKVLWEMQPQPDGSFFGELRDSRANRLLQSRVTPRGNKLLVDACDGEDCTSSTWVRLR